MPRLPASPAVQPQSARHHCGRFSPTLCSLSVTPSACSYRSACNARALRLRVQCTKATPWQLIADVAARLHNRCCIIDHLEWHRVLGITRAGIRFPIRELTLLCDDLSTSPSTLTGTSSLTTAGRLPATSLFPR